MVWIDLIIFCIYWHRKYKYLPHQTYLFIRFNFRQNTANIFWSKLWLWLFYISYQWILLTQWYTNRDVIFLGSYYFSMTDDVIGLPNDNYDGEQQNWFNYERYQWLSGKQFHRYLCVYFVAIIAIIWFFRGFIYRVHVQYLYNL